VAPADKNGKSDPYVKFSIGFVSSSTLEWQKSPSITTKLDLNLQTKVVMKTLNPVWEEDLVFDLNEISDMVELQGWPPYVIMELWDRDSMETGDGIFNPDDLIGYTRIHLSYFVKKEQRAKYFALFLPRKLLDEDMEQKYHNAGDILLRFSPQLQEDGVALEGAHAHSNLYKDWEDDDDLMMILCNDKKQREGSIMRDVPPLISQVKHERLFQIIRNVYINGTVSGNKDNQTTSYQHCHLIVTTHRLAIVTARWKSDKQALPIQLTNGGCLQIWLASIKSCSLISASRLEIITHAFQVYQLDLFPNPDEEPMYSTGDETVDIQSIRVLGSRLNRNTLSGEQYTSYNVVTEMVDGTTWDVWHRYKNFWNLNDTIDQSSQSMILIQLPFPSKKRRVHKSNPKLVDKRTKALETYLNALLQSPNGQRLIPLRKLLQLERRRSVTMDWKSIDKSSRLRRWNKNQVSSVAAYLGDHIFWRLHEENFFLKSSSRLRWDIDPADIDNDVSKAPPQSSSVKILRGEELYNEFSPTKEYRRQFAQSDASGPNQTQQWKLSNLNTPDIDEADRLCITYPDVIYFPSSISDDTIKRAAKFRKRNRVPTLSFWYSKTGAPLVRSSQPRTGVGGKKSKEDIALIKAIIGTTTNATLADGKGELLIVDCRSSLVGAVTTLKGGGTEQVKWYQEDDDELRIQTHFCNIPNIHEMRKSIHSLVDTLSTNNHNNDTTDDELNDIKKSNNFTWFDHIKTTLSAGLAGYEGLQKGRAVLVHCSDGWDRTAQVTCLIQIFADPYFRTVKGFSVLVAKEFCAFGHKFSDRGGYGSSMRQASPIFLQFLDCVYQLTVQNQMAFEFNEDLLLFLAEHIYSRLFPAFLFNSEYERAVHLAEGFNDAKKANIWEVIERAFKTPENERVQSGKYYTNTQYSRNRDELVFNQDKVTLWDHQYVQPVFNAICVEDATSFKHVPSPVYYMENIYAPNRLEEELARKGEKKDVVAKGIDLREFNGNLGNDNGGTCVLM